MLGGRFTAVGTCAPAPVVPVAGLRGSCSGRRADNCQSDGAGCLRLT